MMVSRCTKYLYSVVGIYHLESIVREHPTAQKWWSFSVDRLASNPHTAIMPARDGEKNMFTQQDMAAVVEQLKTAIAAGKFTCHRCHMPLGGASVTQIDLFNGRVVYKCSNVECDNHNKPGYRTLRAMNIDVPGMKAPADLAAIAAPAPPRPEEVSWSDGSNQAELLERASQPSVAPQSVAPVVTPVAQPTHAAQKPAPAASQNIRIEDDPNSEE